MKAKIVLCDDDGNVLGGMGWVERGYETFPLPLPLLPNSSSTAYDFDLGGQTLDEIEQAVEEFRCYALPELEANILQSAQQQHTEDF